MSRMIRIPGRAEAGKVRLMHHVLVAFLLLLTPAGFASTSEQSVVTAIDLANLRDIGGHARGAINVSPDGLWVVFQLQTPKIAEGDYELTWVAVSTHSAKAFRVADGGDVLLNPGLVGAINGNRPEVRVKWSPDSRSFAYLVRRNEQTQIWQSRPDRKGQIQLTENAADVIDFAWSSDGSRLYFTTALSRTRLPKRFREESTRGFFFDDRLAPLRSSQPIWRYCGVRVNDSPNLVSIARACEPATWIYDRKTRKERHATSEEAKRLSQLLDGIVAPEAIQGHGFKRIRQWGNGKRYAWLENTDSETYQGAYAPLTVFALIGGEIHQCVVETCQAYDIRGHQDLWWSHNGQEVVFLRRDGPSHGMTGLYAWTPSTGRLRQILQTDDWLSDCAPAGDRLICLYETWTQPRKIVSVSLENGFIATLYDPNPEFVRHRFSKIEKLEWEDAFGNATHGHLVYPIDYQPGHTYPLVIVTYQSRGFLRGGVGDEYPIHPLAAEGFFVLSHEEPTDMEVLAKEKNSSATLFKNLYWRKSVLSSQEIIIERLAKLGLIDENGIAITGLSEGAVQTHYALIHSDFTFAAAIASSVGIGPSTYYLMNENVRRRWRALMNGSPDDRDSSTHMLSIGLNAVRIDTPLLVNVSDQDFVSSVENITRLKSAGKPVELYVFPREYHIKWRPQHRLAIYRRNIQWLKFWLMGEMEPDPVSPDQYGRWISLCRQHVENLRTQNNYKQTSCVTERQDALHPQ